MEFFDDLGKKLTETAESIGKKTEEVVEIQKMKNQIRSVEKSLDKIMMDLGKMVYQTYEAGESVPEEYWAMCDEIQNRYHKVEEYRKELADIKGLKECSSCNAAIPIDAVFCSKCGAKIEE